jgi:hypothetical protein
VDPESNSVRSFDVSSLVRLLVITLCKLISPVFLQLGPQYSHKPTRPATCTTRRMGCLPTANMVRFYSFYHNCNCLIVDSRCDPSNTSHFSFPLCPYCMYNYRAVEDEIRYEGLSLYDKCQGPRAKMIL